MTPPDVGAYRKRLEELQTLLRGVTDPQALQALKDEIARLEARIAEADASHDDRSRR